MLKLSCNHPNIIIILKLGVRNGGVMENEIDISAEGLEKGIVRDGQTLVAWDSIQTCVSNCPIFSVCNHKTKEHNKCNLQIQYLQNLTNTIFTTYRYCSPEVMFKIGMHLVPLYSQLCRQKIVEKAVIELAYEDAKGVTRIHPIYKEIRETLKVITLIWKEMGFSPNVDPNLPKPGRPGFGDPNHYENISANSDNKRNVIR